MNHAQGGDRQLGRRGPDELLQFAEVVSEDDVVEPDLSRDIGNGRGEIEVAPLVVEMYLERLLRPDDSSQLVDEIHVPGAAAELAVRRGAQAHLLLHPHDLADRLVLDLAEPLARQAPARERGPGFEELLRTEQAADVVGPERRCGRHGAPQSRGSFTSRNLSNSTLKSRPAFFSTRRT